MTSLRDRISQSLPPRVRDAVARAVRAVGGTTGRETGPGEAARDPLWHRQAVGGLWEEIGRLQFDFMVDRGLRPEHQLLDIGCGSLRGGVRFVEYLDPGHYVGVDVSADLLAAGRGELRRRGLLEKNPALIEDGSFSFSSIGREFDYAIAQSVFTHLPLNSIHRCLVSVSEVLRPSGELYATFFDHPGGKHDLEPQTHHVVDGEVVTFFDRDPYHYDVDAFRWIVEGIPLELEHIGGWDHPRDQRMLLFRKPRDG